MSLNRAPVQTASAQEADKGPGRAGLAGQPLAALGMGSAGLKITWESEGRVRQPLGHRRGLTGPLTDVVLNLSRVGLRSAGAFPVRRGLPGPSRATPGAAVRPTTVAPAHGVAGLEPRGRFFSNSIPVRRSPDSSRAAEASCLARKSARAGG